MTLKCNGAPLPSSAVTPPTKTINGRGIKHRRLDHHQLAHLAADCVTGAVPFQPSIEQACLLFGVPRALVRKHLKARNGSGGNGGAKPKHTLADRLRESTPGELIAAARALGIDVIWDRMIAPVVVEERAAVETINDTA